MKPFKRLLEFTLAGTVLVFSAPAFSDEVVHDDLIVTGDACAGSDCVDGEVFDFLGIKIKNAHPQIRFEDTSGGTFPTNDWAVGTTDDAMAESAYFFIKDADADTNVLVLEPGTNGGVALGSGATVEANAVSVGAAGAERRIKHVAEGVDDTDAVNKAQLDSKLEDFAAPIEKRMDDIEARIEDLSDRIKYL